MKMDMKNIDVPKSHIEILVINTNFTMTSFWPLFLRLEFPPLIFSIDLSLGVLHIKQ